MKKNNKWDIRLSNDIIYFFLNIDWKSPTNTKQDSNIKLTNKESKYLLSLLCKLYNIKLPQITSITVHNKKYYTKRSKSINISDKIGVYHLLYAFYDYLSDINGNIYKSNTDEIDYSFQFTNKFIQKLQYNIDEYIENDKIANSAPENISYWMTDNLGNRRFLIFKENAMVYLYVYHHLQFMIMMKRFFGNNIDFIKLFQNYVLKNTIDIEIFKDLCKLYSSEKIDILTDERASRRIKEIGNFFKLDFSDIKTVNNKNKKYLDLGGGDGSISKAFGLELGLEKKNIVSADVPNTFSVNEHRNKEEITYITLDPNSNKLPFKKNEFFIISIFMVLHHIKDIDNEMKELNRILVPGGYIVLREHNAENINEKILIDIEHRIYDMVIDGKIKKCNIDNDIQYYTGNNIKKEIGYEAYYKSAEEWIDLFNKYGFQKVDVILPFKNQKYNVNKTYTHIFKKI